jgi:hypothetical protein
MYQYSHGLSVYFPWTEQLSLVPANGSCEREARFESRSAPKGAKVLVMENYKEYQFTKDLGEDSWASFLEIYFAATMRTRREEEDLQPEGEDAAFATAGVTQSAATVTKPAVSLSSFAGVDIVEIADALFAGSLAGGDGKPSSSLAGGDGKPSSSIGQPFVSTMIKNFPTQMDATGRKRRVFSISPGALQAFKPDRKRDTRFKLAE